MIGTATSSLLLISSAAWPPKLNTATRQPVLPRFLVGMASGAAGVDGVPGSARMVSGSAACASTPAVTAPPILMNSRRSWPLLLDSFFLTRASRSGRLPLLEIKIGKIHVAVSENANGENMLSLRQRSHSQVLHDVPMMPLAPSHRVGVVFRGHDLQGIGQLPPVQVQRDRATAV